jgi:hypothetical protein
MEYSRAIPRIIELLTPLVGSMMAETTIMRSCTAVKANPGYLTEDALADIGKDIERRLAIFLGSEKAAAVGRQIADIDL